MGSAFSAVIAWTSPVSGASAIIDCPHGPHVPRVAVSALDFLTPQQVRERYPMFDSVCTQCKQRVQMWAGMAHFMAGGWHQQGGTSV